MRKDILEELDLLDEAQNADSVQDLENIFAKVKEKTELVPIAPSSTSGVWGFTNAFATGDFSEAVTYIYKDAATDDRMSEEYIKSDVAFCYFNGTELTALSTVNQLFLTGVRDNEDADIREKGKSGDAKAGLSPNFGFSSDSTGLDTEIAGMTSAKNEFVRLLNCGIGNAQENLAALNEKMKAAGVGLGGQRLRR